MQQDGVTHLTALNGSFETPAEPIPGKAKSAFEIEEAREGARKRKTDSGPKQKGKTKFLIRLGKLNSEPVQLVASVFVSWYQAVAAYSVALGWPAVVCDAWWPSDNRRMAQMAASVIGTFLCFVWGATGRSSVDLYLLSLYIVWMGIWTTIAVTDAVDVFHRYFCVCGALIMALFYVIFLTRGVRHLLHLRQLPRQLMSKQKRRHVDEQYGFDLDLTYISGNIIAMGWPSSDLLEGGIRNQMPEVKRYMQIHHPGHHRVYNLCSERKYPDGSFEDECQLYRFPDHNPCRMEDLIKLCEDIQIYLDRAWNNVAALHCKAGKGRTGMVICCYLLHSRKARTAEAALTTFGKKRTYNGKGVTIPSQIRYIYNYEVARKENCILRDAKWFNLQSFGISGVGETGNWEFAISMQEDGQLFSSESGEAPPSLEGDIRILVSLDGKKVFQFWFHTAYNVQPLDDTMPASTPIWTSPHQMLSQDKSNGWYIRLTSPQLDMVNKKARKEENPLEVTAIFVEADQHTRGIAEAERDRRRADQYHTGTFQQKMLNKKKKKRKTHSRGEGQSFHELVKQVNSTKSTKSNASKSSERSDGSDEDTMEHEEDLLNNLTDLELLLSSLHAGYLNHMKNRCIGDQRRWCALQINGFLNITDDSSVKTVNLTQKNIGAVFKKEKNEPRWWIKPMGGRFWESIEAAPEEEGWWTKAFADAIRLGEAKRDPDILFCGFFWKLAQAATKGAKDSDWNLTDWRIRLFILRKDGSLLYHSWKEGASDDLFCRIADDTVTRLEISNWACWDFVVPFTIQNGKGKNMVLAGVPQDLDVFTTVAQGILKEQSSPSGQAPV